MLRNSTQHVCLNAATNLVVAALLAVPPVSARNRGPAASAQSADTIRVCVNSSTYASVLALNRAKAISTRMLVTAGVVLEWRSAGTAACRGLQPTRIVVLDFAANVPPNQHPGAMAFALPYEAVHIVVLFDRIKENAGSAVEVSTLLAHVMTHEITHLLQGVSRHSETGVMKAHWDVHDFLQMAQNSLPFTPEDIDLIQLGLRRLAGRTGSVAPAPATMALH
jgi:hypothetical protein